MTGAGPASIRSAANAVRGGPVAGPARSAGPACRKSPALRPGERAGAAGRGSRRGFTLGEADSAAPASPQRASGSNRGDRT